ncbi:MAG: hypothetical protein SXV54_06455 [Chloroflexota bacterium]|nr:hypothetical protein [Chloroflexota bacterium]
MSKEAGWIATMLAVLLIVVALLSPRTEGQLPTLQELERPPATICWVPLVGPIIGRMQRLVTTATWQLEAIPIE